MKSFPILFFGTPDFALPSLQACLDSPELDVIGVFTQPDRPKNRGQRETASPVKQLALKNNLPVFTPFKVDQALGDIQRLQPRAAVVVAFGQILSKDFLQTVEAVNVHASLLPRWRGAAPIQRTLMAGDRQTGVCLQRMVLALDEGDIIGKRSLEIGENTTGVELHDQLKVLGAELLQVEFIKFLKGQASFETQAEEGVTYAPKIKKEESQIHWTRSAEVIHNQVRALTLGSGTFCYYKGKKLKICQTKKGLKNLERGNWQLGEVIALKEGCIEVACGESSLLIEKLQPESRKPMGAEDYLRGYPLQRGELLA